MVFNTFKEKEYIKLYHDYSFKLLRTSPRYIHVIINALSWL